jgi:hypothetical protein
MTGANAGPSTMSSTSMHLLSVTCCARCQFLKQRKRAADGAEWSWEVTSIQRDLLAHGSDVKQVIPGGCWLACHVRIWDGEDLVRGSFRDLQTLLTADRGESCFFLPYTPGTFFPPSGTFECLEANRCKPGQDRRRVRWIALVVGASAILGAAAGTLITAMLLTR